MVAVVSELPENTFPIFFQQKVAKFGVMVNKIFYSLYMLLALSDATEKKNLVFNPHSGCALND
jgi:hypothetical protein